MTKEKNGGSAFPCDSNSAYWERSGMTLRDYFAAKAMQAQLTAFWALETHHGWSSDEIAQEAYAMADAMLKGREL